MATSQTVRSTLVEALPDDGRIYVDEKTIEHRTGISRSRLQSWRAEGEGPPFHRLPGNARRVLYKWSEVVAFIESGKLK